MKIRIALLIFSTFCANSRSSLADDNEKLKKIVSLLVADVSNLKQKLSVLDNAITLFDTAECPKGWTAYSQLNGRYVVGTTTGNLVGKAVGEALSGAENRATGKHSHGITDHGHFHEIGPLMNDSKFADNNVPPRGSNAPVKGLARTKSTKTGISINSSGKKSGTNAPYMFLRACKPKK